MRKDHKLKGRVYTTNHQRSYHAEDVEQAIRQAIQAILRAKEESEAKVPLEQNNAKKGLIRSPYTYCIKTLYY
jgi:uncharacterized protein YdgA (DUF945 family)